MTLPHKTGRTRSAAGVVSLLIVTMLLAPAADASGVLTDDSNSVTIRYELPEFGMKLIMLEQDGVNLIDIQEHLELAVVSHLNKFVANALPDKTGGLVNKEAFRNITIESIIEKTPIDIKEEDDINLSVIRSGFEGVANFIYDKELAAAAYLDPDDVQLPVHIYRYIKDAFQQYDGFWDFADIIVKDDVLSRTGKLQIAVGKTIVGEGSLVGDDDEKEGISTIVIVAICVVASIFAFCVVTTVFVLRQGCKERALERQKLQRRERAKRIRKNLLAEDHSQGSGQETSNTWHSSGSSEEQNHWLDAKTKSITTVNNRTAMKKSNSRVRSRPAMEARKSSDRLLHCIVEESSNHDDTSRRSFNDKKTKEDIENIFGGGEIVEEDNFRDSDTNKGRTDMYRNFSLPTTLSNNNESIGSDINMGNLPGGTDGSVESGYYYTNSSFGSSNASFANSGGGAVSSCFNVGNFDETLSNDSSGKQDIFCVMNQEGFDTLNPDEFDFDLGGSNDELSMSEEGNGSLNCSINMGDFGDALIASSDDDDDYDFRMDPHLTFA